MSCDNDSESIKEVKREEGGEVSGGSRLLTVGETRSPGVDRLWSAVHESIGPADAGPGGSGPLPDCERPDGSFTWTAVGAPGGGHTLNPYAAEFVPGVTYHIFAEKFKNSGVCFSPWNSPPNISCGQRYDSIWRESSIEEQLPRWEQDETITEPLLPKKPLTTLPAVPEEPEEAEEEQDVPQPVEVKKKRFKILAGLKRRCSLM
ncbi:uncharacterized protein LOC108161470 isoform X1 [Drosophila miranda]|uniref:uncharacterized protein LOC108161470 isoform X1 n=1 Tax=Drosophila miranda TaxID=7229 RepID=UPI0007E7F896|nr:uncharacterized protein LOC108161470 isoform X1 [Drosophila miranda]XP_017151226.1 uncharacterized protein LOC108161470 isoform X1 [Drosophila miranda]